MANQGSGTRVDERSTQVASTAREQASDVAQNVQEQTKQVAQKAQEQARSTMHRVMDDARERANDEAVKVADTLHGTSEQMREMADAPMEQGLASTIVREGANAAERLASRLDEGGVDRVLADVRSFARRSPGAFLFGAAAAGFFAGRIMRNFSSDSMQSYSMTDSSPFDMATGMPANELDETSGTLDLAAEDPNLQFEPALGGGDGDAIGGGVGGGIGGGGA